MASAARDLRSHVTDVVTCPICLKLCDTPNSLPCLHTFCLKCIEGHCRDNEPGDVVSCPVCRQKFRIPDNGVQVLVSNLFIAGLVEARKTASDVVKPVPCEVCVDHSDEDGSIVAASTMYCVDCDQKLCEQCSRPHRKMRGGPHKVVSIGNGIKTGLIQMQGGKCDKHKNKRVELFCINCKVNICVICFAEEHQQHKCKNIDTVATESCKQMDADMELVKKRADGARNEISRLEEQRRKLLTTVEKVSEKILERGEELKQLIDKQVKEQMAEVRVLKTKNCKEIESHKENVEIKLVAFETFNAYCSELKSKGKPYDITRAANDLHIRANELIHNYVTLTDYCAPNVTFRPINILELVADGQNLTGVVEAKEIRVARVVHTLPQAESVNGVTLLDDKLYVLRDKTNDQVEVYKIATTRGTPLCSLLRHLSVPGLKGLTDMTSCKHNHCVYIADGSSNCVHRVELYGKVTKWLVKYEPYSLSVTPQFSVIVTNWGVSKLLEFTTEGKQLREINLQSDILTPRHAIQLSNGQFVVSHGDIIDPVNRVCIVDTNGHVTQSYGGPPGSATVGQLNVPAHLAVDKDGYIFVADVNNRRVLLLSPTLSFVREIVSRDLLKWEPRRLFLFGRCLYVADNEWKGGNWTTGRVVVIQF